MCVCTCMCVGDKYCVGNTKMNSDLRFKIGLQFTMQLCRAMFFATNLKSIMHVIQTKLRVLSVQAYNNGWHLLSKTPPCSFVFFFFFWCTAVSESTAVLPMSPPAFYYAAVRAA